MNNIKTRGQIALATLCLIVSSSVFSAERDPFASYIGSAAIGASPMSDVSGEPAITKHPVTDYEPVGLINSPRTSIALLRTPEGIEYFVKVGDKVGSDGHLVTHINNEELTLTDASSNESKLKIISRVSSNDSK